MTTTETTQVEPTANPEVTQREPAGFLSRKFLLALMFGAAAIALCATKVISESGFVTLVTLVYTTYCGANVFQKRGEKS